MFDTASASAVINTIVGNISSTLTTNLPIVLGVGAGLLVLGFFWRLGKRHVTGKKI